MNTPRVTAVAANVLLIITVVALVSSHREVSDLKSEHDTLLTRLATAGGQSAASDHGAPVVMTATEESPSSDLLRLRNEVTRLRQRNQELKPLEAENQRLQSQLVTRTNKALTLPEGYVRRVDARWVGLNTPASTLQSFLWAIQSKNASNVVQVLTPEAAAEFLESLQRNPRLFEEDMGGLPGMRVVTEQKESEGAVEVVVEILPGQLLPETLDLKLIDGQWKLAL